MLSKLLITTAVSGLIISGAIAQSETPTAPPAKDQSAAPKESTSASGTKFIMAQSADQWVFTKFKGLDVRGPDNASIGSVNDLLFDGTGKIIGVVIGVGGFLGIGAKNVAIDMSALDVVPADSGNNDINNTPAGSANDPSKAEGGVDQRATPGRARFSILQAPCAHGLNAVADDHGVGASTYRNPAPPDTVALVVNPLDDLDLDGVVAAVRIEGRRRRPLEFNSSTVPQHAVGNSGPSTRQ